MKNRVGIINKEYTNKVMMALCIVIITLFMGTTAQAAEVNSTFSDVDSSKYYAESVENLVKLGAIKGFPDGNFHPYDNVTQAEMLKILTYSYNVALEDKTSDEWYSAVENWAVKNGMKTEKAMTEKASRAEICGYLATINQVELDMSLESIFNDTNRPLFSTMNNLGIVNGIPDKSGEHKFSGESNVTRADACVMVNRAIEKLGNTNKIKDQSTVRNVQYYLSLDNIQGYYDGLRTKYESVDKTSLNFYIDTWIDIMLDDKAETDIIYGIPYNENTKSSIYNNIVEAKHIADDLLSESRYYFGEYGIVTSRTTSGTSQTLNSMTIKSNKAPKEHTNLYYFNESERMCNENMKILRDTGKLKDSMTEKEKLDAIYEFININYEYDDDRILNTTYEMLTHKKAVCAGFVGVYCQMAHILNIPVEGYVGIDKKTGINHIIVKLDTENSSVFIDPTYGESHGAGLSNREWFWMDQVTMESYFEHKIL